MNEVWKSIAAFAIDEGEPALSFTARLARENGWTPHFAERVVEEYRRFLYLAMTAGHSVTPSEHVDQVWHLHLTYTRSYWDDLCARVFGKPLHHGPTRGGRDEGDRYRVQYGETLAAYARVFGASPPRDIWPPAEQRFGADLRWRRVNTARSVVVPKAIIPGGLALLALFIGLLVVAAQPETPAPRRPATLERGAAYRPQSCEFCLKLDLSESR